jgi:hypothetical protein
MADGRLCIGVLKVGVYIMGSLLHKISEPTFSQAIFSSRNDDLLTADWQIPRRLAISTVVIPNSRFAQKQIKLRAFTI